VSSMSIIAPKPNTVRKPPSRTQPQHTRPGKATEVHRTQPATPGDNGHRTSGQVELDIPMPVPFEWLT
jgi:hypothetical protein